MATDNADLGESPFADDVYAAGVEDAEFLDPAGNLTGDDLEEPLDTSYSPPDFEPSAAKRGMTLTEQQEGPSLDDRLAAEVPDRGVDAGLGGSAASAEEAAMHFFDPDEREVDELEPVEVKEDGDRPVDY